MTTSNKRTIKIERTYQASIDDVWSLWTTKKGLESWWGPQGFTTEVLGLDLRVGGEFRYAMTATNPEMVAFMTDAGMAITTDARATYTEVHPKQRLAYVTLADFVPGIEPYDVSTLVEFHANGRNVRIVLTFDPMHNDEWTERMVMGHESQLGKLEKLLA